MMLLVALSVCLAALGGIESRHMGMSSLIFDDSNIMAGKPATVHFNIFGQSAGVVGCMWYDKLSKSITSCESMDIKPDMSGSYSTTCVLPKKLGNVLGSHKVVCANYDTEHNVLSQSSKDFSVMMDTSGGILADSESDEDDEAANPGPPPGAMPGWQPGGAPLDEDDIPQPDPGPGPSGWDDDYEQPTLPPGDTPGELPQPAPIPDPGPWHFDDDGPTYPPQVMPGEGPGGPVFSDDIPDSGPAPAPIDPVEGDDNNYTPSPTQAPGQQATLTFEVTLSDVSKSDWDKDSVNSETAFGLTTVAVVAAGEQVTLKNMGGYVVKALPDANGASRITVQATITAIKETYEGAEGPADWYQRLSCDINGDCQDYWGIFSWQLQDEARLVNAKALETAQADKVIKISMTSNVAEDVSEDAKEVDTSGNVTSSTKNLGTGAIAGIIVAALAAFALVVLSYRMYSRGQKTNTVVLEDLGLAARATPSHMASGSTHNPMAVSQA